MQEAIRVWGVGTLRTFRVHWMLHELGLEYETRPVQSRTGETQTPEFLALNPRGKIPVLEHGDLVLAESAAIAHYLAERLGAERELVPAPGTRARALHDQWCFFVATELDATSLYVVRRHRDLPQIYGEAPAAIESSLAYFRRQLSVVESELGDGREWLDGERFRVADVLLTSCLDWAVFYGETLPPALAGYQKRMRERSAYARAAEINYPPEVLAALRRGRGR